MINHEEPLDEDPDEDTEAAPDEQADSDPLGADDPDENMSVNQHLRLLLRLLHDSVDAHVLAGDFEPSPELERAMNNARVELDWN